jgi:hypothetical protein
MEINNKYRLRFAFLYLKRNKKEFFLLPIETENFLFFSFASKLFISL